MTEPKLEVPAELRDLAEKTIDQAEKAFGMFFDAAGKSMASVPEPRDGDFQAGAVVHRTEYQGSVRTRAQSWFTPPTFEEAMRIQSGVLAAASSPMPGEHMRQITGGVISAAGKD